MLWWGEENGVEMRGDLIAILILVLVLTTIPLSTVVETYVQERLIASAYFPSCLIPLQRK